jgi:hypothetical protein
VGRGTGRGTLKLELAIVVSEQCQQHPEDVDDVEEDLDGGEDVLLGGELQFSTTHDHLDVDRQVEHEEQCRQTCVDQVQDPGMEKNRCHDGDQAEHHQHKAGDAYVAHHRCDVVLGLHGKDDDAAATDGGDDQAKENGLNLVLCGNHHGHVAGRQRQDA